MIIRLHILMDELGDKGLPIPRSAVALEHHFLPTTDDLPALKKELQEVAAARVLHLLHDFLTKRDLNAKAK